MKKLSLIVLSMALLVFPASVSSQWGTRYSRVLSAGTYIPVTLSDDIDGYWLRRGDQMNATLDRDLFVGGRVVAPAGSRAIVSVVDSQRSGRWFGGNTLSVMLTGLQVGSSIVPIETSVRTVRSDMTNPRLAFRTERSVALDSGSYRDRDYRDRDRPRELARVDDTWRGNYGSDHGVLRWRGVVDGTDYIELQGNQVTVRHMKSQPIMDASFDLRTPLPRRPVNVQLNRIRGRGVVDLVEQPRASNGYKAVIYIQDDDGGQDVYEFELSW
jgi:hypothetical protein